MTLVFAPERHDHLALLAKSWVGLFTAAHNNRNLVVHPDVPQWGLTLFGLDPDQVGLRGDLGQQRILQRCGGPHGISLPQAPR